MVSGTNKRHYSTISVDNSPFSHVSPLPLPSRHYHPQPLPLPLPFTNHPLPYPPPGAIVAPPSATHPHPHPQYVPQPQQQQYQPPQREIKFIFETGRKEPKTRKITKPKEKDSAKDMTGCSNGRKVLANKSIKDPNITRKPKPSPLNLAKPAKLPLTIDIDIDRSPASHMPSPPLTAGLFPSHHLPKITHTHEYPYSPQNYHRHFPQQVLPPIETFRSVNMIEGFGSSPVPGDSPPLPIDAPIPKAPIQAYTPFFEDSLAFPGHESDHSEEDGEYDMEVEVGAGPIMGLGLDLGLGSGGERREMMDFVPRKPSLDIMMHDEEVEMDSARDEVGMGLGLSLFN